MSAPETTESGACHGRCSRCMTVWEGGPDACRSPEDLSGWRLGISALVALVLPLVLTTAGAMAAGLAGAGANGKLAAGIAGFVLGSLLAAALCRRICPTRPKENL